MSRGIRIARIVLIAVGILGLAVGAGFLVTTVQPKGITGLAVWLAAAVVLHDGILAPVAFLANRLLRGVGRRVPAVVLAVLQITVVVGVIMTLIVLPEIRAKQLGPRNPSVLPFDYAMRLGVLWVVLALLAAGVCALLTARSQRIRGSRR